MPYYLENVNDSTGKGEVKTPELRIQKNDLLSIQINSIATDPKIDGVYNLPVAAGGGQSGGYLVDAQGNIEHFRLGTIHAEGMTKAQLAIEIKKRLTTPVELLRDPTVIIRFLNFKVYMLGEVGQQGVINVPGESITILEAVGLAGGVSEFGKKNNLKIQRQVDGKREVGTIDLSSKDIYESPFYNLLQNDVVIVEQSSQKLKEGEQAKTMQKITFAFTIVTIAATMANIFIRN